MMDDDGAKQSVEGIAETTKHAASTPTRHGRSQTKTPRRHVLRSPSPPRELRQRSSPVRSRSRLRRNHTRSRSRSYEHDAETRHHYSDQRASRRRSRSRESMRRYDRSREPSRCRDNYRRLSQVGNRPSDILQQSPRAEDSSRVLAIEVATHIPEEIAGLINDTRRIINGWEVTDGRPYMVHLKLPKGSSAKHQAYRTWLCGGIIVHEEYIITSAACIEDAEHFYIISGTYKYNVEDDKYNSLCIKNGAKKAIWKCIPKNYVFDGHENDNIRWMNNDIAVVKVEDGFDFERRVRGCDFVPKPVPYNNQSQTLENPGNVAWIAGWGSTLKYSDWASGRRKEPGQQDLLETRVEIIAKNRCKRRWGSRYSNIIDNYMVCSKDLGQTMSEICNEKYVDCQDINYSEDEEGRRFVEKVPTNLVMHSVRDHHKHILSNETDPRRSKGGGGIDGGFCENDHGGPLIYGEGVNSIVIGIISACLVKERSNKCYGPFLYTSIYKNRQFISCSIFKDVEPKCRRQFRSGVTHDEKVISWKNHEDGPAVNELDHPVKNDAKYEPKEPSVVVARPLQPSPSQPDKVYPGRGYVVRAQERIPNTTVTG